jgi:hypothetical protein
MICIYSIPLLRFSAMDTLGFIRCDQIQESSARNHGLIVTRPAMHDGSASAA